MAGRIASWRQLSSSSLVSGENYKHHVKSIRQPFDSFSSKGGKHRHRRVKALIIFEFAAAVSRSQILWKKEEKENVDRPSWFSSTISSPCSPHWLMIKDKLNQSVSGVGRLFGGNLFSAFCFTRVALVQVVVKTSSCFQCATPPLQGSYGPNHSALRMTGQAGRSCMVGRFYRHSKTQTGAFGQQAFKRFFFYLSLRSQRRPGERGSLINTTLFLHEMRRMLRVV